MTKYLKSIVNAFKDLIFIIDENGIIVDYLTHNHQNELIVAPPTEIYKEILPSHVNNKIERALEEIRSGAESAEFDYSIEQKGEIKWYSAVISEIKGEKSPHFLGVVRDITNRIQSERTLEESEKKYRKIVENLQDVFYRTNRDGVITEITPSIERYSGFTPDDVIGKKVEYFYFYPKDRRILLASLNKRGEVIDFEVRLKTKMHQMAYASVNAHLTLDKSGKITGIEGNMRDITKRKKAEQKVIRTNEELKKLNAQKDKLFSVIAHDLRNFVSGSTGLFDLIFNDYDSISKEELYEYLKLMEKSSSNAKELLEDLLMWSKNQFENVSINPESLTLREIVDETVKHVKFSADDKHIDIENRVPESQRVYADPNMLKTILRNLLNNAVKFSHESGKITVLAEESGRDVRVSVSDNGIGMSDEVLGKIFDRNINYTSRGTKNEKGSGLGLDLCIDFVEKHRGRITAASKPGEGSTFTFTFPKQKSESVV